MSMQRIHIIGLLASIALIVGSARGQDFNQRYAAWQGRAPAVQRTAPQMGVGVSQMTTPQVTSVAAPEVGGETEALPTPGGSRTTSQRILGEVYNAPVHTPNYNNPWTTGCSNCYHNPTFEPGSDPIGTCNYMGGGPLGWGPPACGDAGCSTCGGCGSCGGCGPCGGAGGCCDYGPLCCNPIVWLRLEALLWFREGRHFPPIVTTDPAVESSTTAGHLPDAHVLFGGGQDFRTNMMPGGRVDFGTFIDPTQTFGIGDRFFWLGRDGSSYNVASNNVPVLVVPFHDTATGSNSGLLVAYPGLRTGSISVTGSSGVVGNDVYARFLLCRDCINRWDFITGWNFTRITDDVALRTRSTVVSDPTIPAGTVLTTLDQFRTANDFNGGILGLQWQRDCGYWMMQLLGRMSIGNMHESMAISGSNAVNGTVGTNPAGGVYTRDSNTGVHSRDEFTAITEVGFNLAYRFAPNTQLVAGYTLMYFNDYLSPANSIDTSVNPAGGSTHPAVVFRHSDFWLQGVNLGLTKQF